VSLKLPFEKQDLLLLRTPVIIFIVAALIASVLYFGSDSLNRSASFDLSQAQARYEQAMASVREIADEEETIIRYIDRYREIEEEGAVRTEDRLALIEQVGDFRTRYNLYPIQMDIGGQGALALKYDPLDLNPGAPVNVNFSDIAFSYSLVHEEDLTRLLNAFIDESGLLVPNSCEMKAENLAELNFTQLGFNLAANCELFWFTFDLAPPEVIYEY
tara:strand:- start:319 stop:966 length:648 start_codon:yes stop_codon:yes gene_type:complete